jgi:DNA-binding response OmpR family regulator
MRRSILLVSRDDNLQIARSAIFQNAGYQAFCVDSVTGAVLLVGAERPEIALLCFTFGVNEQHSFIERVRETNSSLFVLCLRDANVQPSELIDACERSFIKQPGMARVRVFSGEPV